MCNSVGAFRGSYVYTYSKKECEDAKMDCTNPDGIGNYGTLGIVMNAAGGPVVSTVFKEDAGPSAGVTGSNLYTITSTSDTAALPGKLR
jgi:hypothetical protein